MSEESKYLDKLFQSKFAAFETEPPAAVWDNVHAELHGKGGGSINPVNLAVLAALIMISGLLGYSIINNSSSTPNSNMVVDGQTAILFQEPVLLHPEALELPAVIENRLATEPQKQYSSFLPTTRENSNDEVENTPESQNPHNTLHAYYVETTFGDAFSEKARIARLRARTSHGLYS